MFLIHLLNILLLIEYRNGYAHPICATSSSNTTTIFCGSNVLAPIDSIEIKPPEARTLFSIFWSCLLTVIICAWSSVHPNLPPRNRQSALTRRIKLMFWTIVAPELVLAWAVRQWYAAMEVIRIYNHREVWNQKTWKKEHGYFLVMGGYQLVNGDIKQLKEPYKPGWIATSEDLDTYDNYQRNWRKCQLGVLTLGHFKKLMEDPHFEMPKITSAEIRDRAKGDGLSKMIAILQTSWFIIQCLTRCYQGLALTELELVTLAMASLNAITFTFWWSKPLGVQESINVYISQERLGIVTEGQGDGDDDDEDFNISAREVIEAIWVQLERAIEFIANPLRYKPRPRWRNNVWGARKLYMMRLPFRLFFVLVFPIFALFPLGIVFLLWILKTEKVEKTQEEETVATRVFLAIHDLRYNLTHPVRKYFGDGPLDGMRHAYEHEPFFKNWFFILPASFFLLLFLVVILSPFLALFFIASFIFTAVFEIVTTNTIPYRATHVPAFYSPRTKSDRYSRMIVFAIFGVVFGGIHCIGWNFFFPTHSECAIWRYTSIVLTIIPLVAAPIDYILENFDVDKRFGKVVRIMLDIFMTALLFVYVPARLSLIAQAFALLRNQPPTAYVAVDWTKYIPRLL